MNRVLKFVQLDFRLIKPYYKSALIMLAIGFFMGFMFKSATTLASYFMMMLMLLMSYPFAIADKNSLDIFYGTLSINKKQVVVGRYGFVLLCAIFGSVLSALCSVILSAILKQNIDFGAILLTVAISFALFSLVVSLQYPIYFKYSYTKAKSVALIPLMLVFAVFLLVPTISELIGGSFTLESMFTDIVKYPLAMGLGCFFIGLLVLAASCFVSYKIYKKKDA